jgi:hypothetical protein
LIKNDIILNINILEPEMFSPIYYREYSGIIKHKEIYDDIVLLDSYFCGVCTNDLKTLMSHKPSFLIQFNAELKCVMIQCGSRYEEEEYNEFVVKSMRDLITKEFLCYANCYWKYDREVFYQKKSD